MNKTDKEAHRRPEVLENAPLQYAPENELSWNFKHLSNIQKQISVKIINEREGYFYPLILTNPMEVVYENE